MHAGHRASPVRLAAGHNLLEVHDIRVATLLEDSDLSHGCDWDACSKTCSSASDSCPLSKFLI